MRKLRGLLRLRGVFGEFEKPTSFKALRLVLPEQVELSLKGVESPVFVSPTVEGGDTCRECNTRYTPLVYQTGYVVESQHFCSKGGIYYYSNDSYSNSIQKGPITSEDIARNYYGFAATVIPMGIKQVIYRSDGSERSEKVYVRGIEAFCMGKEDCEGKSGKTLTQGSIVLRSYRFKDMDYAYVEDIAIPICGSDAHPKFRGSERYRFRVNDGGEVMFGFVKSDFGRSKGGDAT